MFWGYLHGSLTHRGRHSHASCNHEGHRWRGLPPPTIILSYAASEVGRGGHWAVGKVRPKADR